MHQSLQETIHRMALELQAVSAQSMQEAWWILQTITKRTMLQLLLDQNFALTDEEKEQLDEALYNRVEQEMPLQYILGQVPFCGMHILVEPPILIPRPETEEWVQWLIKKLAPYKDKKFSILDLGTGSGCIALALAKHCPLATVVGIDINQDAILLAEKNKASNNLSNVSFILSDLFSKVEGSFDIIVSNPPYLSFQEWKELESSVIDWEDARALAAGKTGLECYEKIINGVRAHLTSDRVMGDLPRIIFELGVSQVQAVTKMLADSGFGSIKVHQDMSHKDRWITAK